MARKQEQVETPPEEAPGKRGFLWLWILLAVVCFGLFVVLLHMSGALRGGEEAFYQKVKGVPVIGFLATPLHKESWEGRLTPDQVIDVKDLRRELLKTQNTVNDLKKMKKSIKSLSGDVSTALESVEKIQTSLKDMEETYTPGAAAAAPAAGGRFPARPRSASQPRRRRKAAPRPRTTAQSRKYSRRSTPRRPSTSSATSPTMKKWKSSTP